ncbi:trigger factor [Dehalobacter sp. MCB1]|uniref:trigger factor n=1 Tax=unclassified Dehalobacter TaxID=2635733 RepID=UPI000EB83B94|nr:MULTISPECIES: trigger factor [unclassified Dehalobacter]RJE48519.1 trigger factor [Dehalobacter sp. MCB1]
MHEIKLGSYKGLKLPPVSMFSEDDLNLGAREAVKKLANQWAKNNMPAVYGDEVVIGLRAECDNMFVPELSNSNLKFTLGDPSVLEAFSQIINHKAGDDLVLSVTFPEGFTVERMGGKTVTFQIAIHEVNHRLPVELSDEIARQINPEVSGIDELQANLRKIISENWLQKIKEERIRSMIDAIASGSEYTLDQKEFQEVLDILNAQSQKELFSSGNPQNLEALMSGDNRMFEAKNMALAEKTLVEELILTEIARLENIDISPEEIQEAKSFFLKTSPDKTQFSQLFPNDEFLGDYLFREKIIHALWKWNDCDIYGKSDYERIFTLQ